jgi:hypothetical protein
MSDSPADASGNESQSEGKTETQTQTSGKKAKAEMSMEELMALSTGGPEDPTFMISTLPMKELEQFLCGLIRYIDSPEFLSLTFAFDQGDSHADLPAKPSPAAQLAVHAVVIALKHALPRARNLIRLSFQSVPFATAELPQLARAIGHTPSLRQIEFDGVPLEDEGFQIVSSVLRNMNLVSITFGKCELTDASVGAVHALLVAHQKKRKKTKRKFTLDCLESLDLQYNAFSYRLLLEIGGVLAESPLKILDLRHNQAIDRQMAVNMKRTIRGLEIRVNTQKCRAWDLFKALVAQYSGEADVPPEEGT